MFKNKFFEFAIIASIVLTLVMVTVPIPMAKAKPRNIPVALVNEDKGAMGSKIVDQIKKNANKDKKSKRVLNVHEVKTETKLNKDMDDQKYYGALVIPKDFSKKCKL